MYAEKGLLQCSSLKNMRRLRRGMGSFLRGWFTVLRSSCGQQKSHLAERAEVQICPATKRLGDPGQGMLYLWRSAFSNEET